MSEAATPATGDAGANIWTSYSTRDRTLLTIGCVASWWIFKAIAGLFSYPKHWHYEASLLVQPSPVLLLIMCAVVLVICVLLTSFFAGVVHYDAGLFCACVGMVSLSVHGGPMRNVLMEAPGNGIFPKLMLELTLLFVFVVIGWMVLGRLRDFGLLREELKLEEDPDAPPYQGAMALAATVVIMGVLMLLLAQTDKKAQAIWSVAISACLASLGAHSLFPARPSVWFWTAPLIVGLIGYVLAWMGGNNLPGGAVGGIAPALARPLPLDYASVGVAGAIYGYWWSRQWHHEREHDPATPAEVEEDLEHPPGTRIA